MMSQGLMTNLDDVTANYALWRKEFGGGGGYATSGLKLGDVGTI
jgi:hypothetical protein